MRTIIVLGAIGLTMMVGLIIYMVVIAIADFPIRYEGFAFMTLAGIYAYFICVLSFYGIKHGRQLWRAAQAEKAERRHSAV